MLSLELCKKHLKNKNYTDEQVVEIRNSLYQLSEILVINFMRNNTTSLQPEKKVKEIER